MADPAELGEVAAELRGLAAGLKAALADVSEPRDKAAVASVLLKVLQAMPEGEVAADDLDELRAARDKRRAQGG